MVKEKDSKCEIIKEKVKRDITGMIIKSQYLKVKGDKLDECVVEFDKKWERDKDE